MLEPPELGILLPWLDYGDDVLRDAILQLKDVAGVAVEAISPNVNAR